MGRMSPAAYDNWWRTRIVREEADYANHILRNWQLQSSAGTSSNPITQELTLNSLGAPQLIAPTHNRMQQQLETKSSSAGAAANGLARNSSSGDKPPTAPGSRAGSKPATAVVDSNGGKEGSRAGSLCSVPRSAVCAAGTANKTTAAAGVAAHNTDHDNNSGSMVSCKTSGSIISMASRPAVTPAGRSVVSCAAKSSRAARSDVSYPQTPNFSQVGSSVATTEVMSRLARLEADLATEKKKREAAEAEMRQLLASRGSAKPGVP